MSVLLIFIDGCGIGERDNPLNPFVGLSEAAPLGVFQDEEPEIIFGGRLIRTDPRMGVEGRPQSASGQTTILTGVNAPAFLGYHKQGFPNAALRETIEEYSIFWQLENFGIEPNVFANAYTPQFFTETPRWKSATTVAVEASTVRFRTLEDMLDGKALFHDFTNQTLRARGFDAPVRSPAEAGKILARLAGEHRFTLYEHFLTDKIGHAQDFAAAQRHLPQLAEFVRAVLENVDLRETTVLLTSDHGNIEDLRVRTHTLNDVPTLSWGKHKEICLDKIRTLADITPTIIEILANHESQK